MNATIWQPYAGSHQIAQYRTAHLFDCALQIDYWRNGRVELRPPPGWAFFCVAGDLPRHYFDGVKVSTG